MRCTQQVIPHKRGRKAKPWVPHKYKQKYMANYEVELVPEPPPSPTEVCNGVILVDTKIHFDGCYGLDEVEIIYQCHRCGTIIHDPRLPNWWGLKKFLDEYVKNLPEA